MRHYLVNAEVIAAQKYADTSYEIFLFNNELHSNLKLVKEEVEKQLDELKEKGVDVVLLAMGLCGNALDGIKTPIKLIVPKVDDCMTMLLHSDDQIHFNLKLMGHFYLTKGMTELCVDKWSDTGMTYEKMVERFGEEESKEIIRMIYASYSKFDIIDTGVDSIEDIYLKAKDKADLAGCSIDTVPGSNIILENMLSGKWDNQFLVFDAGETISMYDFISN